MRHDHWIEIISVRLSDPMQKMAVHDVFKQIDCSQPEAADFSNRQPLELYLNMKTETDWSVFLHWDVQQQQITRTKLGASIAEALASLGLVNHSLWLRDQAKTQ